MLRYFHQLSLSTKAASIVAALVFACCALIVLANSLANKHLLQESTNILAQERANHMAKRALPLIQSDDKLSLQSLLRIYTSNPLIVHGAIYDAEGRPLVETGRNRNNKWQVHAEITEGNDSYGDIIITLEAKAMGQELTILAIQLLILSGVLSAVTFVACSNLVKRLETQIGSAREQLASPVEDLGATEYPGRDELGQLLREIHRPPLNTKPEQNWGAIKQVVLQVKWQRFELVRTQWDKASFQQLQKEAYERSAAVARLYRAEIQINQLDGVTIFFNHRRSEDEGVFYAMCCALLLNDLGLELGAHPRMSVIEASGNHWQVEAAKLAVAEELHATEDSSKLPLLLLDEPELQNAATRAELDGNHLSALKEPYQQFLHKQLLKLKQ